MLPVDPAVTATAAALNVKLGGGTAADTVKPIVAPALSAPLVPVTASAYAPGPPLSRTLIVTPEAPKAPVIPAGQLEAANVTGELNPLAGVTVKAEIPVDPAVTATAAALNVKLGGGTEPPVAGAKKIALATGFPAAAVIVTVTVPLMFHTP